MNAAIFSLVFLASVLTAASQTEKASKSLAPGVKEAIIEALVGEDGEYAARAKYTAIVEKFGPAQPYGFIRNAENYQVLALEGHLKKYGIAAPTDRFAGKVSSPATLQQAAAEAISIEERSIISYERLLKSATADAELTRVVLNLQRLTRDGHLPAVKAAAESGGSLTAEQIRTRSWKKRPAS
jgi:hypothetical protein